MSVRKKLEEIIKRGKSAAYNGVFYTSVDDLPTESELSKGDKEKEEAARKSIKAELRRLAEELAILDDEKEAQGKTEKPKESSAKNEEPKEGEEGGSPKEAGNKEKAK